VCPPGGDLFVGNQGAGDNAAIFYSLVTSAKLNGVEPFAWLKDVMEKLPMHRDGKAIQQSATGKPVSSNELDTLLPDRWLQDHPDCRWEIDSIRREERRRKEMRDRALKNCRKRK